MSCSYDDWDGAYVLGALAPGERLEFERHLAGCAPCTLAVRQMAGLPGLLGRVDGGALDLFLDNLDPSVVGQAGSSIGQTIAQGTSLLALTKSGADRALVIMSDGEGFEPQDELVAAARRAAAQNVDRETLTDAITAAISCARARRPACSESGA